ncbi:hypothetical protein D3C72_2148740 [compost metagenome]
MKEADAGQVGIFLQDGQQAQDAATNAINQFGTIQTCRHTRLADRLAQALREHADQLVVGRLLA